VREHERKSTATMAPPSAQLVEVQPAPFVALHVEPAPAQPVEPMLDRQVRQ
jgi:hypothetical protein